MKVCVMNGNRNSIMPSSLSNSCVESSSQPCKDGSDVEQIHLVDAHNLSLGKSGDKFSENGVCEDKTNSKKFSDEIEQIEVIDDGDESGGENFLKNSLHIPPSNRATSNKKLEISRNGNPSNVKLNNPINELSDDSESEIPKESEKGSVNASVTCVSVSTFVGDNKKDSSTTNKRKLDDSDSDEIQISEVRHVKKSKLTHDVSSTNKNGMYSHSKTAKKCDSDNSIENDDPVEVMCPKMIERNCRDVNTQSNEREQSESHCKSSMIRSEDSSNSIKCTSTMGIGSDTFVGDTNGTADERKKTEERHKIDQLYNDSLPSKEKTTNVNGELAPLILECCNEELSEVQSESSNEFQSDYLMLLGLLQNTACAELESLRIRGRGRGRARGNRGRARGTFTPVTTNSIPSRGRRTWVMKSKPTFSSEPAPSSSSSPSSVASLVSPSTALIPASLNLQEASKVVPTSNSTVPDTPKDSAVTAKREESPEIEVVSEKKSSSAVQNQAPKKIPANSASSATALLNILARPSNMHPVVIAVKDRKKLDVMVKTTLVKSQTEFVEYLFSLRLLKDRMMCPKHPFKPVRLGLFRNAALLPASGGYVWVMDCCGEGTKFISVFSGSIFAIGLNENISATSVLKLIYHWSCQTTITNVETWVRVSREVIGRAYHYLRCVCAVILQNTLCNMGAQGTCIELGIVSLGTTTADGSKKSVKVEILGLYDRTTKAYRLYASAPQNNANASERFMRILKPVLSAVHHNAVIVCDGSLDQNCLPAMNYKKVVFCTQNHEGTLENSNSVIMTYLRKHVPKMFQNSLSQLSLEQVQLVLDELCWRETFGRSPSHSYTNIMKHIAYLTTKETENNGLLCLLDFVAQSQRKCWWYVPDDSAPDIAIPPDPKPSMPTVQHRLPAVTPINRTSAPTIHPAVDVNINTVDRSSYGVPQTIDVHPENVISPLQHENKIVLSVVNNELQQMRNTVRTPKPIRLEPVGHIAVTSSQAPAPVSTNKTITPATEVISLDTVPPTPASTAAVPRSTIPAAAVVSLNSTTPRGALVSEAENSRSVNKTKYSANLSTESQVNSPRTCSTPPTGNQATPQSIPGSIPVTISISCSVVESAPKPKLPISSVISVASSSLAKAPSLRSLSPQLSSSIRATPSPASSSSSGCSVVEVAAGSQSSRKDRKELVPHFYGEVPGDRSVAKEKNLCDLSCHLCSFKTRDNVDFYTHMKGHLFDQNLANRVLCPYCIICFDDQAAVVDHIEQVHNPERENDLLCRICMVSFESKEFLVRHMLDKHVEAELPYRCEVCNYATSYFTKAIDHFNQEHRGAPYVQCHFCLLVRTVSPPTAPTLSSWFLGHLLEHARGFGCTFCTLTLKNRSGKMMQEHMVTHTSYKLRKDLVRYTSKTCRLTVPCASLSTSTRKDFCLRNPITSMRPAVAMSRLVQQQEKLRLHVSNQDLCAECRKPLNSPGHFNSYYSCTQCPYATSCRAMMPYHNHKFHSGAKKSPVYRMGPRIFLRNYLVCCCGYFTKSGHKMATHLATCQKSNKTAYPEESRCVSANTSGAGTAKPSSLKLNLALFVTSDAGSQVKIAEEDNS